MILGINQPGDFWKYWNCPRFTRAISKFSKIHLGNLSKITLPNMWLLVLSIITITIVIITIVIIIILVIITISLLLWLFYHYHYYYYHYHYYHCHHYLEYYLEHNVEYHHRSSCFPTNLLTNSCSYLTIRNLESFEIVILK